jgi:hypothetical protein
MKTKARIIDKGIPVVKFSFLDREPYPGFNKNKNPWSRKPRVAQKTTRKISR